MQEEHQNGKEAKISPWLGVWFRPRAAIHSVFKHVGDNWMHRLAMFRGMLAIMALRIPFWVQNTPEVLEVMILVGFVGPVAGLFFLYLNSGILGSMIRRFSKINVSNQSLRIGISWSFLPVILGNIFFILICILLFPDHFELPKPPYDYHSVTVGGIVLGAFFIWSFALRVLMTMDISVLSLPASLFYHLVSLLLTDLPIAGMIYTYAMMVNQILVI